MSFILNSLQLWNLNITPFFSSNLYDKIDRFINEKPKTKDFDILIINNVYGYRCGLFFKLFPHSFFRFLSNSNTTTFSSYLNNLLCLNEQSSTKISCSNREVVYGSFMLLNRSIPFLNFGNYDLKKYISQNTDFCYYNNNSLPKFYNLSSLYSLKPFFDSGCCILSNKKPIETGFMPFPNFYLQDEYECDDDEITEKKEEQNQFSFLTNKGITWSYFEENLQGLLIITFTCSENIDKLYKISEYYTILRFIAELQTKFLSIHLNRFEIILYGDFKTDLFFDFFSNDYEIQHINNPHYYLLKHISCDEEERHQNNCDIFYNNQIICSNNENDVILEMKEYNNLPSSPTSSETTTTTPIRIPSPKYIQNVLFTNKNEDFPHIEDYFKSKLSPSPSSSSSTDEEWTKV